MLFYKWPLKTCTGENVKLDLGELAIASPQKYKYTKECFKDHIKWG